MPHVTNISTQAGMLPGVNQKYYDRKLLDNAKPKLVHYEFGQKRPMPKGQGKQIAFRKFTPFAASTTALTEGVAPEGQELSMTEVTATIQQYGGFVETTDVLNMVALDPIINESTELMGEQAALTLDTLTRNALHAGTNVMFASGTSRSGLTAANVLTATLIRKAVRTLKKNRARPFTRNGNAGYFMCIVGPDTVFDLQNDPDWKDVSKYQNAEQIYTGELGKLFGVVFVETTESMIFAGAGTGGVSVASTLVFGRDAYGVVDIGGPGENMHIIVKPAGSAGTADPLNQKSTVGWKIDGYAAKILQDGWLVRIEHGISA